MSNNISQIIENIGADFPNGKFWNHDPQSSNDPTSVTSTECNHNSHVHFDENGNLICDGSCGCNSFGNAIQCQAFALYLANRVFGSYPNIHILGQQNKEFDNGWYAYAKESYLNSEEKFHDVNIEPGDIIITPSHTAMVWYIDDDEVVQVIEVWGSKGCKIHHGNYNGNWEGVPTVSYIKTIANYIVKSPGTAISTPETPTTEKVTVQFYDGTNDKGGSIYSGKDTEFTVGETYGSLLFTPAAPETGYTFDGWYTAATGSSAKKITSTTKVSSNVKTLYARWSFTMNFHYNDEAMSDTSVNVISGFSFANVLPEVDDSTFAGWYTSLPDGGKIETWSVITIARTDIQACWNVPVRCYYNDGTDGYLDTTVISGRKQGGTLPTPTVCLDDHTFMGWYTKAEKGSLIGDDHIFNKTEQTKVYAYWKRPITFHMNDGSGDSFTREVVSGLAYSSDSASLAAPSGAKTGFTFLGWYTDQAAGSKIFGDYASHIWTKDIFAHWSWDVALNRNDGTDSAPINLSVSTGGKYGDDENFGDIDRYGYNFDGWYTADGTKKITSDTAVDPSITTLYAIWKEKIMNVIFNYNNTNISEDDKVSSLAVTYSTKYGDCVCDGQLPCNGSACGTNVFDSTHVQSLDTSDTKDFVGWYHPAVNGNTTVMLDSDHILTAMWEPKTVTVSFDTETILDAGVKSTFGTKKVRHGDPYGDLPVPASDKNYEFVGWHIYDKETGTVLDDINKDSTVSISTDHTLYAGWSNKRIIFLDYKGYDGSDSTTLIGYFGMPYPELPVLEKEGYTFQGWYFEGGGTEYNGKKVTEDMTVLPEHPNTLYAVFYAKIFKVNYMLNDGTGVPSFIYHEYDSEYYLPTPTKDGYVFTGWYFDEGCTDNCTAEDVVKIDAEHTLYAGWADVLNDTAVTVSFVEAVSGGAEVKVAEDKTVYKNHPYADLPEIPEQVGYDGHWRTSTNYMNTTNITPATIVSTAYDHNLYAVWTVKEPNVRLFVNGGVWWDGTTDPKNITVEYDACYYDFVNGLEPTFAGHAFSHWLICDSEGTPIFDDNGHVIEVDDMTKISIPEDHGLIAQWL